MNVLAAVGAVVTVFVANVLRWRCPRCRRFQGVKGRRIHVGSRWWGTKHYKYSCASCHHNWTTNGEF